MMASEYQSRPGPLVELRGLRKDFLVRTGATALAVTAVAGVDLTIARGECVGLVGESGSGKSTVARLLLALIAPSAGQVLFDGRDLATLDAGSLRRLRREMQVVFQNPHTSLHPRMSVGQSLAEPLLIQGGTRRAELTSRIAEMMDVVGLPSSFRHRYPHELSGGQKQRICIARALMLRPKLVVLDEPTSALDVSVQAQILELLRRVQAEWGLAYLFISHNLAVVEAMCSRVIVMYRGAIVEQGPVDVVMRDPSHPYTARLLAATLVPDPDAGLPVLEDGAIVPS